jgi:di/tricarboxylate transporter
MIVAEDAIEVLPSYLFFLYMLVPSVLSWLLTTFWIERCWMKSRFLNQRMPSIFNVTELTNRPYALNPLNSSTHSASDLEISSAHSDSKITGSLDPNAGLYNHMPTAGAPEGGVARKISRIVNSPFPYGVLIISGVMVALIFVDLISIAGLICVFAVIMVIVTVLGNHWAGRLIWADENAPVNRPLTAEEKALNTNEFFEELFNSIDYSLLLIFLGLFIVVEHLSSTGIPKIIWDSIVGDQPFDTFGSVFRISIFILVASQFIGNVPVIYLAKPNVEPLGDQEKAYAWAVISFVATIGGNLTITGSAANIIVAEKAVRIDPANEINFGNHFQICFFVTLICCFFGALIITGFMAINSDESW